MTDSRSPLPPQRVSSRAANPIRDEENPAEVFCDEGQAKATTATRLFRNEEMFRALAERVIPAHAGGPEGRILNLWSAGCSSGEEAYSLAMVGLASLDRAESGHRLFVYGTDINRERLARARAGVYLYPNPAALPEPYRKALEAHAERTGAHVRMGATVRRIVKFGLFDLRKRPRRHTFQCIVCNHVLQYYDHAGQLCILDNFRAVLRPSGFLYLEGLTPAIAERASLARAEGFRNLFQPK